MSHVTHVTMTTLHFWSGLSSIGRYLLWSTSQTKFEVSNSTHYKDRKGDELAATLRWFMAGGAIRIALQQLLQNRKLRHLWRHNLGSKRKLQKMARENFSIGALYNITENQHNPIKTVGRDSFLSPKTPKIQVFRGHPATRGCTAPIF